MVEKKLYKLDNCTIDFYFQKSNSFLYPLLMIPSDVTIKPLKTYITWEGIVDVPDYKLICVYELREDNEYKAFQREILLKNPFFEDFKIAENSKIVYIFNIEHYKIDFEYFYSGMYSKITEKSKKRILDHEKNPHTREYYNSFLYPEKYYEIYSKHLHISVKTLKNIGELCNPYNAQKETLHLKLAELNLEV